MKQRIAIVTVIVMAAALVAGATTVVHEPKQPGETNTGTMPRNTGGPDPFGYTYIDSNEPGGPAFSWIDISGTGTDLGLTDDSSSDQFPIGFTFTFYGTEYTQVNVGSNGALYFGTDDYLGLSNVCIPGDSGYSSPNTNALIAVYWDDLRPGSTAPVYYELQGTAPNRQLIVMWDGVPVYGSSDPMSFEVILNESDSSILMQYLDVNPGVDAGAGATVGVQDYNLCSSCGVEYLCNAQGLENNLAILFIPGSGFNTPVPGIPEIDTWGLAAFLLIVAGIAVLLIRRHT